MTIRFAATLFALAMPLLAQAKAPTEAEAIFYKAFYLERAERDHANAMVLYEQFLAAAPDHKYAKAAAERQLDLLTRSGKSKDAQAFAAKYEKLLGKGAAVPAAGDTPKPEGDAPRGEGRARGEARPPEGGMPPEGGRGQGRSPEGGRPDPQARITALEKQIADAKAAGDEAKVKELTANLDRMKQRMAAGGQGGGAGGQGGQGGRRAGGMLGTKKLAEMTAEELTQFKGGVEGMGTRIERMKEAPNVTEDQIKTLETNYEALKKALDENKLEDAQKALDKLREMMQRRRNG